MKSKTKYPEYYCVDFEIFVKIEKIGDSAVATNHLGNPYPIGKAIVDGQRIAQAQYEKGVEDYRKSEKLKETKFQKWVKNKIKNVLIKNQES